MGCTTSTPATREANFDGVETEDKKLDRTIEQKQEELAQHELLKPVGKDAMQEWLKKKRLLETELKALQEKHPAPMSQYTHQSSCYSLTVEEVSSDAEPSWMKNSEERLYTDNQILDVLAYCKKRRTQKNSFMDTMLEEPIICEILASYVAEAFYFPPHIFETSFHGNGWICLVPQLQDGQNLVAVRAPTGIQVEWTFSSTLRFELTCEWDVKRQNFKCYYTFYRTNKKPNGTMEHKASDHIRVKAFDHETPFGGIMAVDVNLTKKAAPVIQIFFDGELFQRFSLPLQQKEFRRYKLNAEAFERCTDVNFYLGAKIRHIASFSYA